MNNYLPKLDQNKEKKIIIKFLQKTFRDNAREKAVIGLSGGIDSTTSFFLLKDFLPLKNIIVAHLYYDHPVFDYVEKLLKNINFPKENMHIISIKKSVDEIAKSLKIEKNYENRIRIGNIAARVRMIALFDLAKKHKALVVGTENKSEHLLGYFTRYGDQASDIEPIEHLFKTQVYELAKKLNISEEIVNQAPTAGLWENQTDEGEFGFSYEEADQVLYLSVDKKMPLKYIEERGFKNAKKILEFRKKNMFKHVTPYTL